MTETQPDERDERLQALRELGEWLETPMVVLGFAWLALLVVELTHGLTPALELAGTLIWGVFIADFALRLALAPEKGAFLRANWLTALSLLLPALRFARAFRAVRAARVVGRVRLVKVVGSLNRGMRALGHVLRRRGAGYVVAFTTVVTLVGAAGMYAFEHDAAGSGIRSYGTALWWTAMVMTTLGPSTGPARARGGSSAFCWPCTPFPSLATSRPRSPRSSWAGTPAAGRARRPASAICKSCGPRSPRCERSCGARGTIAQMRDSPPRCRKRSGPADRPLRGRRGSTNGRSPRAAARSGTRRTHAF